MPLNAIFFVLLSDKMEVWMILWDGDDLGASNLRDESKVHPALAITIIVFS